MQFLDSLFIYQMQDQRDIRWHTRWHAHDKDEYEIHYIVQGESALKMGGEQGRQFALNPGSVVIVPPEVEHGVVVYGNGPPLSYYALLFRLDSEDAELAKQLKQLAIDKRTFQLKDSYRFFFEELRTRGHADKVSLRLAAKHQLATLLYLLTEEEVPHHGGDQRIERALQIMQSSVGKDLSLDELSNRLGVTPQYCIKLFKERMAITPMRYFRKLKIEAAEALLSNTNRSLVDIADDLSFYSEFHFSRVFKQYTGEAPSRYRRRHKSSER